ncbi:MAG: hypothetical protein JKY12_01705 [Sneathiella sp.]|nr:hypothetical protein [Sneathiella sp.]
MNWLSSIVFLSVSISITPATAQLPCFERNSLRGYLVEEYAEKPVSAGIVDNGYLIEVFNSLKNDLWVIIMTSPDKTACIMATGHNWRMRSPALPEKNL